MGCWFANYWSAHNKHHLLNYASPQTWGYWYLDERLHFLSSPISASPDFPLTRAALWCLQRMRQLQLCDSRMFIFKSIKMSLKNREEQWFMAVGSFGRQLSNLWNVSQQRSTKINDKPPPTHWAEWWNTLAHQAVRMLKLKRTGILSAPAAVFHLPTIKTRSPVMMKNCHGARNVWKKCSFNQTLINK